MTDSVHYVPLTHAKVCRWVKWQSPVLDVLGCAYCRYLATLISPRPGETPIRPVRRNEKE